MKLINNFFTCAQKNLEKLFCKFNKKKYKTIRKFWGNMVPKTLVSLSRKTSLCCFT